MNLKLLLQNKTSFGSDSPVKFAVLRGKACRQFSYFRRNLGVLGWRRDQVEQDGAFNHCQNGRSSPFYRREASALVTLHTLEQRRRFTRWGARSRGFDSIWASWDDACWAAVAGEACRERPYIEERKSEIDRETKISREREGPAGDDDQWRRLAVTGEDAKERDAARGSEEAWGNGRLRGFYLMNWPREF